MCLWLRHLGAEVDGFSLRPTSERSLFTDCFSGDALASDIGDLRDFQTVSASMQRVRPEIVVHMGAQSLVRRSVVDPVETYATNVMGTVHLLAAIRQQPSVRAVVNVTSDKCYRNNEWIWPYREIDPLGGRDPYSSSKACAELVGEAFRQTYFSDGRAPFVASARAGNVVGGGDWADDRLIPDCVRAFLRAEPAVIRSPLSVRPWQHVLEPLTGYLLLAQRLYESGTTFEGSWNFGPDNGNTTRVAHVVDLLVQRWGTNVHAKMSQDSDAIEATLLEVDSSKARGSLGWRPRLALEITVDWTADWYQRHAAGERAIELCMEQIEKYEAME